MRIPTSCSVFELAAPDEPLRIQKNYNDLDATNRTFLSIVKNAAAEDNFDIQYKIHPFPRIRKNNPGELSSPEFDANFAICMYPDLSQVGPELAYLILDRNRQYQHLFVVTQKYVPDRDHELKNVISLMPRASVRRGSDIYEPLPFTIIDNDEIYNAEESNMLSYWNVLKIRDTELRQQLKTILAAA